MRGVAATLRALHDGERRLEQELLAVAERHRADHEVHHVAVDVARWSGEHARRIAEAARDHGLDLSDPAPAPAGALAAASAPGPAHLPGEEPAPALGALGHRPEPGLLLLNDLRDLHLAATANSLHWEMLAQVAQATGDTALLALAGDCHPETLRQLRWTNTLVKTLAPQLLGSI
ncbi:hypothetical protein ACFVHB_05990 [Kitasatospora sp. NPDC127111]|uniref:hypothetical protein n=1 Tax=Kitasatospora sp. NPDC127111 TaxID=3345363 RepID=UPI00363D3E8A